MFMDIKLTQWNTPTLKIIAKIAQFIFITCAGINIYLSYHYNKKKNKDQDHYKIFIKKHLTSHLNYL